MLKYFVSGFIFLIVFLSFFTEKIHRTIVALAGAVVMVAAGLLLKFYSEEQALKSIDFNTLGLLLGMMILIALLKETGFFEFMAIWTAKKAKGNLWRLLFISGILTSVISMFLDNVTTVILMVPLTIQISRSLGINPIPLLMANALLSNIGGTATLIGDPPNILIGSAAGFSFNSFLIYLGPIVLISWIVSIFLLKLIFKKELRVKPAHLEALKDMNPEKAIKDGKALKKVLICLGFSIILFFIHHLLHIKPAFVALTGASFALLWIRPGIEELIKDIEWNVLLFFAALFVVVGGLGATGLLHLLGGKVALLASKNLILCGVVILWTSAILSAIVDNIPFTMTMVSVIQFIESQGIPAAPLWWALAIGAGFGGNGTPIGSTAGVLTVSISQKSGIPLSFKTWMKSGAIITLATCTVATLLYLILFLFIAK